MEWEYLLGYIVNAPEGQDQFKVVVVDRAMGGRIRKTLEELGLDRWELTVGCSHDDDFVLIFKRQKLYAMDDIGQGWERKI